MNEALKFYLRANGEIKEVHPHYGDDLSVEESLESGQRFFRASLSESLKLIGKDYDLVRKAPFDSEFILEVKGEPFNCLGVNSYQFKFTKVDCTFNDHDRILEARVKPYDEYTDIIENEDVEIDLIKAGAVKEAIHYKERPVLQIYQTGEAKINCFVSNMSWEQDAEPIFSHEDLINKFHFAEDYEALEIEVLMEQPSNESADLRFIGLYMGGVEAIYTEYETGTFLTAKKGQLFRKDNPNMFAWYNAVMDRYVDEQYGYRWTYDISFFDTNISQEAMYNYKGLFYTNDTDLTAIGALKPSDIVNAPASGLILTGINDGTGQLLANTQARHFYSRLLLDVPYFDGKVTNELPQDDIAGSLRNYKRVVGLKTNAIEVSLNFSQEPTEYGQSKDKLYFLPPSGATFWPLYASTWVYASVWFRAKPSFNLIDTKGSKVVELRDAYSLQSVISTALREIAPDIKFEATSAYSEFLYGDVENYSKLDLYWTPKSNIVNGEYSEPAQKAPLTFKSLMADLNAMFRAYWFIENGKFRLETKDWFERGGTYKSTNAVIGIDLQKIMNSRNSRSWDFATAEFTYETGGVPKRYEFSWMDSVTYAFEGEPIEILSNAAKSGAVESVSVPDVTTDIDYVIANANGVSLDGFVVMSVEAGEVLSQRDDITDPNGGSYGNNGLTNKLYAVPSYSVQSEAHITLLAVGGDNIGGTVAAYAPDGTVTLIGDIFAADEREQTIICTLPPNTVKIGFQAINGPCRIYVLSIKIDTYKSVTFGDVTARGMTTNAQNHLLSMPKLHNSFWKSYMPSDKIRINDEEVAVSTKARLAIQDVSIPLAGLKLDKNKLVRTSLGEGQIDRVSFKPATKVAKVRLKHEIE